MAVSETSGPPWIASTASRTIANDGMAATTGPSSFARSSRLCYLSHEYRTRGK